MPLVEKRITLKGHLTRIEAYVERVTTEQQVVTEVDVQGNLTKLKDIEVQLQVVHESLVASKTAKENEAEEHALLQARIERLTSQLLQLLSQCEDPEEDEAKQEGPPVTIHEPQQGPSAFHSIPESLTNKPLFSTSDNVPWEPHAGPSRLHTPIPQTMQPNLISLGEVLNRLVEFQAGAEMRNTRLLDKIGEALLSGTQNHNHALPRLPTLSLPEFSGEYTAWQHFKDMFTTMVDRDSRLSHVQKMQYLMMSVKGTAKRLIEDLAVSADNYAVAWNVLLSHYEDQAAVVHHHVQKFCKMATVTNPTPASFMELYTTANSVLNSLDAMSVSSRDPWVIYLLLNKLDQETKVLWSREITSNSPTIPEFMQFLKNRMKSIERCHPIVSKGTSAPTRPSSTVPFGTRGSNSTVMASTSANSTARCHACNQTDHKIFRCPIFTTMAPNDRLELIRSNKLCRKCLTDTHQTKECTFFACRKCAGPHSTLLHDAFVLATPQPTLNTAAVATVDQVAEDDDTQSQGSQTHENVEQSAVLVGSSTSSKSARRVFLETAVVRILDKHGNLVQCRALLDSGAQANLLSQSFAQRLKLPFSGSDTVIGSAGAGTTQSKYEMKCVVKPRTNQEVSFTLMCQIVPSILQQKLPNWEVNTQDIPIPDELILADPAWHVPQGIDLLIGNEFYNDILTHNIIRLGTGLPIMKETQFGWVISGAHRNQMPAQQTVCMAATVSTPREVLYAGSPTVPRQSPSQNQRHPVNPRRQSQDLKDEISPRLHGKVTPRVRSNLNISHHQVIRNPPAEYKTRTIVNTNWKSHGALSFKLRSARHRLLAFGDISIVRGDANYQAISSARWNQKDAQALGARWQEDNSPSSVMMVEGLSPSA
ncbi:uncharacterized protein LOC129788855 [Lutzomyia longipalpis]|uniref:uncharacterized protein LOC129788855 n=1 Tax=Lutzomyia longipalpis TaxID=7200 RepID=UPI002483A0DC|nr:uncharacterized protein LOC129788855 [Lutzomyia longipalpis]XP_055681224.1 uncharacterized protein LOC129788855 [Lutzomyia longipalpis]XP_055681225.1 uncharacterized protein LOC129788855 [Lutzomyia longipalpis]XP_055681226.1 uncharacterized protein LOC129788855 [Lutzomyia longipalpis]